MSFSTVLLPILAALSGAENFMGLSSNWKATNELQHHFLTYLTSKEEQLSKLSPEELKTLASFDYEELNKFLKDNNFAIELEPFGPCDFGVVSVLDILIEWEKEGKISTLVSNDQEYPAVTMNQDGFEVLQSESYKEPIIKITAKNGDLIYMCVAQKSLESFELLEFTKNLSLMPKSVETKHYATVQFPMVDFDHQTDITWLLGLTSTRISDRVVFSISQALQQTKFKMNEKGAHVKSAVAIALEKCLAAPLKNLIIDKPFYLWIERPGISLPLFTAYIDTADWKNPNSLNA